MEPVVTVLGKFSKEVSKHLGKWVALDEEKGVIAVNDELKPVIEASKKINPLIPPHVFKVPREDELIPIL